MTAISEPLTPPECDLRGFQFMPLDVVRLRDSDLAALESPEACWAAVLLWCASWHQLPAASLPDDDRVLSQLAGFGRVVKEWLRIRPGALRGWIKCSDGRLYHPVVAEKAREAWSAKQLQRYKTECARIKKHNQRNGTSIPCPSLDVFLSSGYVDPLVGGQGGVSSGTSPPCPPTVPRETPSKGQGEGQGYVNPSSGGIATDGGRAGPDALKSPPIAAAAAFAEALAGHAVACSPADARLRRWEEEGATMPEVRQAIVKAVGRRRREHSDQPLNVGLVDVILADILAARAAPSVVAAGGTGDWWETASGITAHGAGLDVHQGETEPFPYFKARVFEAAGDGPWIWNARGGVTICGGASAGSLLGEG